MRTRGGGLKLHHQCHRSRSEVKFKGCRPENKRPRLRSKLLGGISSPYPLTGGPRLENFFFEFADPNFFKAFHSKMSSVGLNFECRCQANFCLNVACRMKKWANVTCRNKAFMGPITTSAMHRINQRQCLWSTDQLILVSGDNFFHMTLK